MIENYSYLNILFNPFNQCILLFLIGTVLMITGDDCLKPNHEYKNRHLKRYKRSGFFIGDAEL